MALYCQMAQAILKPVMQPHNLVKELLAIQIPLLGICLGHQILALACGAHTFKMHHGHHGANHPILRLADQRVFISSQNHHFSVEEKHFQAVYVSPIVHYSTAPLQA